MIQPKKCFVDGCHEPAPYGLGFPGLRSDLPPDKRGYLWHCMDHKADAIKRRDAAMKNMFLK